MSDISDWAGKLVGAVLRMSGILCRANSTVCSVFLDEPTPLVVDAETMKNAITMGRPFQSGELDTKDYYTKYIQSKPEWTFVSTETASMK